MDGTDLGNIRGAAVDEFLAWYGERDGSGLCRVVRGLPHALQSRVTWTDGLPRLMPFTWYPCELVHGIFDGLLEGSSAAERDRLAKKVAYHVMEVTLRGIYRAMFKAVASPKLLAKVSPRLFRLYYDSGDNTIEIEAPNRHRSRLAGWKGHHPFLCDVNRYSGDWIYGQLGCQSISSKQVTCVDRGDPDCSVLTTWS